MTTPNEWDEAKAHYDREGYVVLPGLLSADDCNRLLTESAEICRGTRGAVRGITTVPDGLDDTAVLSRYLTVQFPHKASALIRDEFIAHPAIADALSHLIGPNVKCMQSMLFIKPSGKPGQAWHQMSILSRHGTARWLVCGWRLMMRPSKTAVYGCAQKPCQWHHL